MSPCCTNDNVLLVRSGTVYTLIYNTMTAISCKFIQYLMDEALIFFCDACVQYIPCGTRHIIDAYIQHVETVANEHNIEISKPIFVTREALAYEVMFDRGDMGTKIH